MDFDTLELKACTGCIYSAPGPKNSDLVLCHRFPPVLVADEEGGHFFSFAPVGKFSWCGEWKERTVSQQVQAEALACAG